MKAFIGTLLLAWAAACTASNPSDVGSVTAPQTDVRDSVQVNGPLRLVLKDTLAPRGFMYALPSIKPQSGSIVVSSTRYGSLCRLAVSGRADIHADTVALHVTFSERLTVCTAEVRALTYEATISGLTHGATYDVLVIHDENGQANTLRNERVVVQ